MKRLALAFAADAAVVVAFAAVGRRSHDESDGLAGVLATAAPFLCGLVVAWLAVGAFEWRRRRDLGVLTDVDHGVAIALLTVAVGLLARRTLWDRGTALTFVIVTAVFVTFFCAGWRALWHRLENRHASARSSAG